MAMKRRRHPEEMADGATDPQEKLDELTGQECCDAEAFHEGSYARSAEDAYEATERRCTREPSAGERRRVAAILASRVIAKAARA